MAKFCTKCGKPLVDGKPCTCSKENVKKEVLEPSKKFDFNECVNDYVQILKGMFTKPIDTIKNYASTKYFVVGIIALILSCIINGIFTYCFLSEVANTNILSIIAKTEVSFMRVFSYALIFSAIQYLILGLMIYLLTAKLFKDKTDWKTCFALLGVCSIFMTVATLVSIILIYLSFNVMFIVLAVVGLFYFLYLYHGLCEITEVDKNRIAFIFISSMAVTMFVVLYVLPKLLS